MKLRGPDLEVMLECNVESGACRDDALVHSVGFVAAFDRVVGKMASLEESVRSEC